MPNGCGLEWAECSLIIGTGCRVQVFSLIIDSSVSFFSGHSVCLRFGVWDPDGFESCIQQRKTTCLLSIRISLACARASRLTTNISYWLLHLKLLSMSAIRNIYVLCKIEKDNHWDRQVAILISLTIGCTGGYQNDNIRCSRWWGFGRSHEVSASVMCDVTGAVFAIDADILYVKFPPYLRCLCTSIAIE